MSAKASYRMVVIFEDEVRTAARLLRGFFDPAAKELSATELTGIIEACFCALQGADDEDAVLVMGKKPSPAASGNKPQRATK